MIVTFILAAAVLAVAPHSADAPGTCIASVRDASRCLPVADACFVAHRDDRLHVHGSTRAATRFVPASTFKIPNALIALETGVASGPDFELSWDGVVPEGRFWTRSWSRDHTLETALQDGVLWYFQELARRTGPERMGTWVDRFGYGNGDTAGVIDRFWLDGPLAISAFEQVEFLDRLLADRLGVSSRTTEILRRIARLETRGEATLSGKTGTAPLADGRFLSWFVGWIESPAGMVTFALNMDCPDFRTCDHAVRRKAAWDVLTAWGLVDPATAVEGARPSPRRVR